MTASIVADPPASVLDGGTDDRAIGPDMTSPALYTEDRWHAPFAELRNRAPVSYVEQSAFGPHWNVVSHKAIQHVESLPHIYSSSWEYGGITVADPETGSNEPRLPMFIAMDRPKHTEQRRTVAPAFTPAEMTRTAGRIRRRTAEVLDGLPAGETFDWVDRVSIELTTGMLADLFDFPWDERRKLTLWSDWAGDIELATDPERRFERLGHLFQMASEFRALWDRKLAEPKGPDLISTMIHSEAMAAMSDDEFMGNLVLLIVGGNDTTRNSMTAVAYGLAQFPDERARLEADPKLIPNAVSEIIRWQTPLAHMRRTALVDAELEGQRIAAGDKIVLWYISANRDETVFADPDRIVVDRSNARRHLAFGHGVHRCVGARLAELQLQTLLEEMAARRMRVEPAAEPVRVPACFVHGYRALPVRISRY